MKDCIFCKIISGEVPADFVKKTESVVAFKDISPAAQTHILVVPTKHIKNLESVTQKDAGIMVEMTQMVKQLAKDKKLKNYRIIINGGSFIAVDHMHWHLQSGKLTKKAVQRLIDDSE